MQPTDFQLLGSTSFSCTISFLVAIVYVTEDVGDVMIVDGVTGVKSVTGVEGQLDTHYTTSKLCYCVSRREEGQREKGRRMEECMRKDEKQGREMKRRKGREIKRRKGRNEGTR